ncbi:MAG TPA: DUF6282 family protein [Caulobacterales bacterium]|nr:DUF6282 family protein [Caulobacterales bacterium]
MSASLSHIIGTTLRRSAGLALCLGLLTAPALAEPELNLKGVIDFHVHSGPDSVNRSIDADDLARLAKKNGMRGLVLKNHFESTATLAYMVRKEVPGIEIFGGITMDTSNGGINIEAVKRMLLLKGGWGRIVWLPTQNAENDAKSRKEPTPTVPVSRDGKLLPNVLELIDFIAQHPDVVLETGHVSAEEVLLVTRAAKERGVKHVVVTHAMYYLENMTIPQMKQAAADGAFIEFDADGPMVGPQPRRTMAEYAEAIRQIGPQYCLLATNFGTIHNPPFPLHPQGMLDFMNALHKEGLSVADINLMAKTNTALALGLKP